MFVSLGVSYSVKCYLMFALIIGDIAMNTVTEHSVTLSSVIILCVVQCVLRLAQVFTLLITLTSTLVYHYGLFIPIIRNFYPPFIIIVVSFVLTIAVRVDRIAYVLSDDGDALAALSIWSGDGFYSAFVLHNIVSVVYYTSMLTAMFDCGNPVLYAAAPWIDK